MNDLVSIDDITVAAGRISGRVHRTPTVTSSALDAHFGVRLSLKAELFQKTGSFKPRGILNRVLSLSDVDRARGLVTVSSGNAAAALAFAARTTGAHATVVMPTTAVASKIEATRAYGADVLQVEGAIMLDEVNRLVAERGYTFVHPFADFEVIAGQGTVGLELVRDTPDVEVVLVPVGGGGLIGGVAAAVKALAPGATVIGVEPEGSAVVTRSLEAGHPVTIVPQTIADGLAPPFTAERNLDHVRAYVDRIVLVSEDAIRQARALVVSRTKLAAEPSAVAGIAALVAGAVDLAGAKVATIISGGNAPLA